MCYCQEKVLSEQDRRAKRVVPLPPWRGRAGPEGGVGGPGGRDVCVRAVDAQCQPMSATSTASPTRLSSNERTSPLGFKDEIGRDVTDRTNRTIATVPPSGEGGQGLPVTTVCYSDKSPHHCQRYAAFLRYSVRQRRRMERLTIGGIRRRRLRMMAPRR